MTLQIIECEQNSEAWFAARLGIPTASNFSAVIARGEGKTRKAYMNRLAAEIITGEPLETFKSEAMERGHAMEAEARDLYSLTTSTNPEIVGFVKNGRRGCSPDALIGDDGILEIKTQRGDLLIETLAKDEFPKEHIAQCMGALWITGRRYVDIAVYWPRMPLFVKRLTRDEKYIQTLATEVDRFTAELDDVVAKIRARGMAAAA